MKHLALGAALLVVLSAQALSQSEVGAANAPEFQLEDLGGRTVRLSDYRGKVVLLNFWATWCPPCRAEMPDLVRLQKENESRGLQIIGITYPAYIRKAVRRLARQLKLNYPILYGSRELGAKYDVGEVLPATIVIDREGKIRGRILGILEPEEFEQSVKPLLHYAVSVAHSLVTARLSSESLYAFLSDDGDHDQSGDRVGPPPAQQGVEQQPAQ